MSTESKGKQGGISSLSEGKTDDNSPLIREAKTDNDKGGKGGYIPYNI